jgi:cardiolipin synthase
VSETRVSVVVTGTAWMGGGIGSIEPALTRIFREAEQEIALTAYAISNGADPLLDWLEAALVRGVQVRLIINRLNDQPSDVVARLYRIAITYPHFHLYDFVAEGDVDLHAKAVMVDRRLALIGSSNLSRRGILFNHEIAVLVEGPAVTEIGNALDRLVSSRYVREVIPG